MDTRNQFTFYASFWRALRRIKSDEDRAAAYDAICAYALDGEEPDMDALPDAAAIAMELIRPNLDAARLKADGGRRGGRARRSDEEETHAEPPAEPAPAEPPAPPVPPAPPAPPVPTTPSDPEPAKTAAEPVSPPVIMLPLADGTEHAVTEADVAEWQDVYPGVDVVAQLKRMRLWLANNPNRRKTARGINKFASSWLAKEQDSGGSRASPVSNVRQHTDISFSDL